MKVKIVRRPSTKLLSAIHTASFPKGWSADYIAASLQVEGTLALVAGAGEGFALLRIKGEEAHVLTFAVRPESRAQGIGKALLAAVLTEAEQRKAKAVFLRVNERNSAAIHLYSKSGFSLVSKHKAYYGNADGSRSDALEMRFLLGAFEMS